MSQFHQISVQHTGAVAHVRFVTARLIDAEDIQQLGDELLSLLAQGGQKAIVLDFEALRFLSSAAIGKLIKMNNRAKAAGVSLLLAGIRPEIYEVFRITRLEATFRIYDSVDAALEAAG